MAKINGASKEFSFMVKLTPEIGFRAAMVKEVSSVIDISCSIDGSYLVIFTVMILKGNKWFIDAHKRVKLTSNHNLTPLAMWKVLNKTDYLILS